MEKKDYSKLRPFDLEAAKAGEEFVFIHSGDGGIQHRKYLSGPDAAGKVAVLDHLGYIQLSLEYEDSYRMAPLAWVRKSADEDVLWPVYKGDVLWHSCGGKCEALGLPTIKNHDLLVRSDKWDEYNNAKVEFLTFTPPKVKREGWVVIEKSNEPTAKLHPKGAIALRFLYVSEEAARKSNQNALTIARIEWEEQADSK